MNEHGQPAFPLLPGDITTRRAMIEIFGGSLMNGIVSTQGQNIFIYSDPTSSQANGYIHDGWEDDSEEVLYYTGEGQVGNQTVSRGNKAILKHLEESRTLRFFESLGSKKQGGKEQRYVGEFMVDPAAPMRTEKAPDRNGTIRDVIVFRLLRISASSSDLIGNTKFGHLAPKPPKHAAKIDTALPEAINLEAYYTDKFEIAATAPRTGMRQESAVVDGFNASLKRLGHELKRFKIPVEEGGAPLLTDTFDVTDSTLWEAKAYSGRGEVRLAIGQIFDYQRYLRRIVRDLDTGIVLPIRPVTSVMDLALEAGHKVAYLESSVWHIESPSGESVSLK